MPVRTTNNVLDSHSTIYYSTQRTGGSSIPSVASSIVTSNLVLNWMLLTALLIVVLELHGMI